MTLLDQINQCQTRINRTKKDVEELEEVLLELLSYRKECVHIFSTPIKGYEHEGGTCLSCGINEVYAHSQSKI